MLPRPGMLQTPTLTHWIKVAYLIEPADRETRAPLKGPVLGAAFEVDICEVEWLDLYGRRRREMRKCRIVTGVDFSVRLWFDQPEMAASLICVYQGDRDAADRWAADFVRAILPERS